MKSISILIPTYNEADNVAPLTFEIMRVMKESLDHYSYEIVFIDNCSTDGTRDILEDICACHDHVRAIFNAKNFGQFNSPYYGLMQTDGDCTILVCADFQDPVDLIPSFVAAWEAGHPVVCGIKTASRENPILYFLRSVYYKLIKKMSNVDQIEHFTGFGLYDRSFIELLQEIDDPTPFLRGIVAEFAPNRKDIPYTQDKRRSGKTKNNLYRLFDASMLSFTSYTKMGLRIATIGGFILSVVSVLVALVYLILKLIYWDRFLAGTTPILLGVFLFGSIQLFFTGLLGEYIMSINNRVMKRPLVVEERRVNFKGKKPKNR